MEEIEEYDIFVCYDELTSKEYAEIVNAALTRKGYKVFVAHLRRPYITGNFEDVIDNVIKNCKVFFLILNYETLTRHQVKREVKFAYENGKISNQNDFWIFHENFPDVSRGSPEFTHETGVNLESMNQNNFSMTGTLAADTLRKCNERRNSQIPEYSTVFPHKEDLAEENFVRYFAAQYENQGYKADFQSNAWKDFYVDLVLRKDHEMILCEFKKFARQVNTNVFRQLLTFKSEIENIEPDTKIRLWLIVRDSFGLKQRNEATEYGIELFDENNLAKGNLSVSSDRTVYPLHSIIHLRIKPEIKIENSPIIIQILDSNQKKIFEDKIPIHMDKIFQEYDIPMKEDFWNAGLEYFVKVKHGFSEAIDSFTVQERGSIIQLDQKVYTWTDQVIITVISPDSDKDNQKIETIGDKPDSRITIKTGKGTLTDYSLRETGESTGIFQGIIKLTGFKNNLLKADHITNFGITSGYGPADGLLACSNNDGLRVTFEHGNEKIAAQALIRWNIGEIQWVKPSFAINDQAVVRVIDPDMNLDPTAIDEFDIHIWSDTDAIGTQLKVKETSESSGIFQGTVQLNSSQTSENSLHVSKGDTITAEYSDKTLPDPYPLGHELVISSTSIIGEIPVLGRVELQNSRMMDENGHQLSSISKGQKAHITCDLINHFDGEQAFCFVVQIKDENNVTTSLSWISGKLARDQVFSPALFWNPEKVGKYNVTIYIWKDVKKPESLALPVDFEIQVV